MSIDDKLSIEECLGIKDIPSFEEALNDKEKLKDIVCAFYGCKEKEILDTWTDSTWEPCHSKNRIKLVNVDFYNNKKESFVLKQSWEGVMTEALGMTLANILIDEHYRFIISDKYDTLAMEEVRGKKLSSIGEDEFNEESAKSYGMAFELANAIAFGDRAGRHTILTYENKIVHIDFGCIFSNFNRNFEIPSGYSSKYSKAIKEGKKCGKKIIKQNFEKNKQLLKQIIKEAKKRGAFKKSGLHAKAYVTNPFRVINGYINSFSS